MTKIPTYQSVSADFVQTIVLEGVSTEINITYNTRTGYFYMTATTESGTVTGMKIVTEYPILRYKKSLLPDLPGDFVMFRTDDSLGDYPSYDDLGNGWDLFYINPNEYDIWEDFYGVE